MDLSDRICVVTGASSGLGLAASRLLVESGATVYGLARRVSRMAEARNALGASFVPVPCDVTDDDSVANAFSTVIRAAGRVDVLVNNAGLGRFANTEHLSIEDWDLQMNTNLRGVFLCTRAVLPAMKQQNEESGFGGHIINIGSVAGLIGNPTIGAYNATKFGLRGFSEALMKEVRTDGIKVTCVYPGSFDTEFADAAGIRSSTNPMTAEDVASTVLHVITTSTNYLISEVVMRPLRPKG